MHHLSFHSSSYPLMNQINIKCLVTVNNESCKDDAMPEIQGIQANVVQMVCACKAEKAERQECLVHHSDCNYK